jgi:hypothetical protein
MKGKRPTTEEKIRILREADSGKSIIEVRKERHISEVTVLDEHTKEVHVLRERPHSSPKLNPQVVCETHLQRT